MEIEIFRFSDFSPKMIFEKRLRGKIVLEVHDEKFVDMISRMSIKMIKKYFVPGKIGLLTISPLTRRLEIFMIFVNQEINIKLFGLNSEKRKLLIDRYC